MSFMKKLAKGAQKAMGSVGDSVDKGRLVFGSTLHKNVFLGPVLLEVCEEMMIILVAPSGSELYCRVRIQIDNLVSDSAITVLI